MTDDSYEAALTSFLQLMDRTDFAGALALFAEDATYVRPVLKEPGSPLGSGIVAYRGKAEIAAFMNRRGQRVVICATRGQHLFAEGVIEFGDGSPSISPLFHLVFDADGRIQRFTAMRWPAAPGAIPRGRRPRHGSTRYSTSSPMHITRSITRRSGK
jgi:SnoaL-like domain